MVHKIMKAKEYNAEAYRRWREAVEKSEYPKGTMPVLSQFAFINERTGEPKKTGYVGIYDRGAIWKPTKKEVVKELKKRGKI